jgi:protein SCO1/2
MRQIFTARWDAVPLCELYILMNKLTFYLIFFTVLVAGFLFFALRGYDFSRSKLAVINSEIPEFSFVNQNNKPITKKQVEGKVYVAEYFFTTCKGICPKMNANMRRVYDTYKNEEQFLIVSHTCMPETDSIPLLKAYEKQMIQGKLLRKDDGSYTFGELMPQTPDSNKNWHFVTGEKEQLYFLARKGYMIDNGKPDSTQHIDDQFIHTQFFALVDKMGRVRGIYDGLISDEVDKMMLDIRELLNEKVTSTRFVGGFNNNPS